MTAKQPSLEGAVFLSHASEDKERIARPLAIALRERGLRVWYDEFVLEVGDSLRASIDEGLAISDFGVVILSPSFFAKRWTELELNALIARETAGDRDVVLPVWHDVDRPDVEAFSLTLADRVALPSSLGIEAVADKIVKAIERSRSAELSTPPPTVHLPEVQAPSPEHGANEPSRLEWHPAVHEIWGQTRLKLVCLRFAVSYARLAVGEGLQKALSDLGSTSYSYDELLGNYDGLLKVWLPQGISDAKLVSTLHEQLGQLESLEIFDVSGIARHWVWRARDGQGLQMPTAESLRSRLSPDLIVDASSPNPPTKRINPLLHGGLAARVGRPSSGIGFFITVQGRVAGDDLMPLVKHQLGIDLERIVDATVGVDEPALYAGAGLADYVLTGRISASGFHRLQADIILPVNRVVSLVDGRTSTLFTASSKSVLYRDQPAVST